MFKGLRIVLLFCALFAHLSGFGACGPGDYSSTQNPVTPEVEAENLLTALRSAPGYAEVRANIRHGVASDTISAYLAEDDFRTKVIDFFTHHKEPIQIVFDGVHSETWGFQDTFDKLVFQVNPDGTHDWWMSGYTKTQGANRYGLGGGVTIGATASVSPNLNPVPEDNGFARLGNWLEKNIELWKNHAPHVLSLTFEALGRDLDESPRAILGDKKE